ncbi:MAG: heme-copper oxidase subunit III [Candidatus Rokubacteria bacterium]|nr:heme-copper oxidase subunit III [Candidatus Rokubacteria bacterium]
MRDTSPESIALEVEVSVNGVAQAGRLPRGMPCDRGDSARLLGEAHRQPVIDVARLGMLIFLGSETMLFAGFAAAFLVFRLGAPVWPPPFQPRLPPEVTGMNTAVLLLSACTLRRALRAARSGDQAGLARGLVHTALLGSAFLAVQGYEWMRLLGFGLSASSGAYGGIFYTLIGTHAVHVLAALTWLAIVLMTAKRGRYTAQNHVGVSLCGMYWSFVVAVWPILYVLVYLA